MSNFLQNKKTAGRPSPAQINKYGWQDSNERIFDMRKNKNHTKQIIIVLAILLTLAVGISYIVLSTTRKNKRKYQQYFKLYTNGCEYR